MISPHTHFPRQNEHLTIHRLLVYLASPEGQPPVAKEEVAAFMPSPQDLIEIDRQPLFQYVCGTFVTADCTFR